MPRILYPDVFDIGDPEHPTYYTETIYTGIIYCVFVRLSDNTPLKKI